MAPQPWSSDPHKPACPFEISGLEGAVKGLPTGRKQPLNPRRTDEDGITLSPSGPLFACAGDSGAAQRRILPSGRAARTPLGGG